MCYNKAQETNLAFNGNKDNLYLQHFIPIKYAQICMCTFGPWGHVLCRLAHFLAIENPSG